ncbi:hypothetical protein HMPREF0349_2854 [Enterococcus faecalis TX1322]|nr:hypothetical protein HMPREF0349_2854 [Enterococcus faecalis TX1322]
MVSFLVFSIFFVGNLLPVCWQFVASMLAIKKIHKLKTYL